MDAALLIARLVLAAVFTIAGVAKLADLKGSRQAIIDFGVPSAIAAPLGLLLPLAELTVAATLLPASTAWWGALGALALLSVFVVGITYNLARGRKPECHCFGQLHSAPAGWKTLARNGVLAAIAGFVLWAGYEGAGPSALSWVGALSTAQLLSLVGGVLVLFLLAGQWWFLVHLLRQNGRLLVRLEAVEATLAEGGSVVAPSVNGTPVDQAEGLPEGIRGLLSYAVGERAQLPMQPHQPQTEGQPCPNCGKVHAAAPTVPAALPLGEPAPEVKLPDLEGNTVELTKNFKGQQSLLVFWNPGCGFCQQMLSDLREWEQNPPEEAPKLLIVSAGTEEANREQGLSSTVVLDQNFATGRAFGASGTPSAVLVDAQGKVASDIAVGAPAVLELAGASRTGS